MRPNIDYHETFDPVARLISTRIVVATAISRDMKIRQLNISTAYLNETIEERVCMEEILNHFVKTEKD